MYTIEQLREKELIIFEAIMGSRAYGTAMPNSDTDIRGVFIQPLDDVLKYGYVEQVSDETNDTVFYELKRFIELAQTNNPNILELLNPPDDCVIQEHNVWRHIRENNSIFLSKLCKNSFSGYAIQQIKKAKGYNKKINWEEKEIVRKNVLDFCYILVDGGSKPFQEWVKDFKALTYKDFALANIDHAHDIYAMYRMYEGEHSGIVSDPDKANQVQLLSIPKGRDPVAYLSFNKDGYSTHCKRYKEYKEWLKNRNEDRFKMNKDHGKNYDSKNLSHCIRLLDMSIEIANGKFNVRRPKNHINLLLSIRKGEMEYDDILKMAEDRLEKLDIVFKKSLLPDKPDKNAINNILLKMRKEIYFLK